MERKIGEESLQGVTGGYKLSFDENRNRWGVAGVMKRNGEGSQLHRCVPKGGYCRTWFETKQEAIDWAEQYLK